MPVVRASERTTNEVAAATLLPGTVFQDEVVVGAKPSRMRASVVSFTPGARTAWHAHPVGQTLYCLSGVGRICFEGEKPQVLNPGDTVMIPPNVQHWHGAAQPAPATVIATAAPAKPSSGMLGGLTGGAKNVQRWLHLGGQEPAPLAVDATASEAGQAVPGAPLPPRRDNVHMASLHTAPAPPIRPNPAGTPADAPDWRRRNNRRVSPRAQAAARSDPIREAGNKARRLARRLRARASARRSARRCAATHK